MRVLETAILVAALATVAVAAVARGEAAAQTRPGATAAQGKSQADRRTLVYSRSGKLVGWVRGGNRDWWASDSYNSEIFTDRKGGYVIYEGSSTVQHAFPRPSGQRRRYVATGAPNEVFRWISTARWNIYRRGRLVAFTRGRDGVAAALAFVTWGDKILPD